MRLFEILLVVIDCALLLYLMFIRTTARITGVAVCLATAGGFLAHLLQEGYRWQMIPSYVVTVILLFIALFRISRPATNIKSRPRRYTGYSLLIFLLGISAFLSLTLPVFQLPKPDGPKLVGTQTFHFVDDSREEVFTNAPGDKRELMVDVWYPAQTAQGESEMLFPNDPKVFKKFMGAYAKGLGFPEFVLDYWKYIRTNSYRDAKLLPASQPYPLVVISHGMGTTRLLHMSQAENLASQGFIVAAIDHTYSTTATAFPDGEITGLLTEMSGEDFFDSASRFGKVWTEDVSFVIRQFEKLNLGQIPSAIKEGIDLNNIGVMGHSFGGATAFNAVSLNERIKAGIDMDGTLYDLENKKPLRKPFMFIQSEEWVLMKEDNDKGKIPDDIRSHIAAELQTIHDVTSHGGLSIYVQGSGHYNFTDLQFYTPLLKYMGMTGRINGRRGADIVNHYVLDFFNKHLKGTNGTLVNGPDDHFPEVKFQPASVDFQE